MNKVEIFYPSEYLTFFDTMWDMIIIEGWFPSIDNFINIARLHSPHSIILFYCLDPEYPGMKILTRLDVDGFLTNSRVIERELNSSYFAHYVQLAADVDTMYPMHNISRDFGTIYIGAGGAMLDVKPLLRDMLHAATPYKLRLHGSHWDEVESKTLRDAWQGILPQHKISEAYASAHVVLAHTIHSQNTYHMINNRIYEALACGAIIMSEYSEAIKDEFGNVVIFVKDGEEVASRLLEIITNTNASSIFYDNIRHNARNLIRSHHTWSHRVIEILGFYYRIKHSHYMSFHLPVLKTKLTSTAMFPNDSHLIRPKKLDMLWVVSEYLLTHMDYNYVVSTHLRLKYSKYFNIIEISEIDWLTSLHDMLHANMNGIHQFDVIFFIIQPFDRIYNSIRSNLHQPLYVRNSNKIQKKMCYIIGYNSTIIESGIEEHFGSKTSTSVNRGLFGTKVISPEVYTDSTTQNTINDCIRDFDVDKYFLNNNPDIYSVMLSDVFDVVLYRSSHEQNEIEFYFRKFICQRYNLNDSYKLSTNMQHKNRSVRSQVLYGISHERLDDDYRSKNITNLMICGIDQYEHCLIRERPKVSNHTLLLLGGKWSDWLNIGVYESHNSCKEIHCDIGIENRVVPEAVSQHDIDIKIFQDNSLADIYHISSDIIGNAIELIASSRNVYLLFGDANCHCKYDITQYSCCDTTRDIMWPLVASLVYDAHLYLMVPPNSHYSSLATDANSISGWDHSYFDKSVTTSLQRLFGLASTHSALTLTSNYQNYDEIPLYLHSINPNSYVNVIVINPLYTSFTPGTDGESCIYVNDRKVSCMTVADKNIYLKLLRNESYIQSQTSLAIVNITISLRSGMYSNSIFSDSMIFFLCSTISSYLTFFPMSNFNHLYDVAFDVYL
jgi:hypothetical protein